MIRLAAAALSLTLLAACGADGPPQPPAQASAKPGIAISGEARIGVVKTLN
jgi:predicted small lipoprotein YifL